MTTSHAQFVGSIPAIYDEHLGPLLFRFYADDLARRIDDGARRVLETACGTGICTEALRTGLPDVDAIVATDLNEPMLDYARARRGDLPGVRFERADAVSLPFDDASFDATVCQFGVMFFPDRDRAMREAHRVLRPGGQLVFNVWESVTRNPVAGIAYEAISGFFEADPPTFLSTPFGYHEVEPVVRLLEEAGFQDVAFEHVPTVVERPDARSVAIGLVEGNPGISEIRERATSAPEEIVEAVADALRAELGDDPVRCPLEAIVFSARRR